MPTFTEMYDAPTPEGAYDASLSLEERTRGLASHRPEGDPHWNDWTMRVGLVRAWMLRDLAAGLLSGGWLATAACEDPALRDVPARSALWALAMARNGRALGEGEEWRLSAWVPKATITLATCGPEELARLIATHHLHLQ